MKEYRIHVEELLDPLYRHGCRVFSVVGSGGKTTLIRQAAMHYARLYQVGVAASTKMCLPDGQWEYKGCPPAVVSSDGQGDAKRQAAPICFYTEHILPSGKIWDLGEQMLGQALEESDLLLIEADGSNRKPLKGWREDEPVILPATEATIGVLPMHCLGEIIDATKVHRMEKFTAITGLKSGDVMREKAYLQLITAENGLFGHSLGSRWLVLNRVNDPQLYQSAKKIAEAAVTSGVIDGWIAGCLENE